MTIFDIPVRRLTGEDQHWASMLARRCSWSTSPHSAVSPRSTPAWSGCTRLADRGFSVLGFPCNQFGGQEPGTADEIAEFCSTTYGVTFPMYEKIEVNGDGRHPIYDIHARPGRQRRCRRHPVELREISGRPGRGDRRPVPARTKPEDPALLSAIEEVLPA